MCHWAYEIFSAKKTATLIYVKKRLSILPYRLTFCLLQKHYFYKKYSNTYQRLASAGLQNTKRYKLVILFNTSSISWNKKYNLSLILSTVTTRATPSIKLIRYSPTMYTNAFKHWSKWCSNVWGEDKYVDFCVFCGSGDWSFSSHWLLSL